jgi:acetylglutamate kinase|nr:acetylglutamate kinase [Thermolongibacillus altinsuensis]
MGEGRNVNTVVIKCGGSILNELSPSFFASLRELKEKKANIVIVHGGGPEIGEMLQNLQVSFEFVNGLRKTTAEVLEIVEMVLCGKVNKKLVAMLQTHQLRAVGLSGVDDYLLEAKPIDLEQLGYVGEVKKVNEALLQKLWSDGYIPVVAPIGMDENGQKYNINADAAAAAVAKAVRADQLLFVTDVPGILREGEVVKEATVETVQEMMKDGTIYGGMIPKVQAALESLVDSLEEVAIVSGKTTFYSIHGLHGTKIKKGVGVYK